jgi:hypothetical protein
VKTTAEDWDEVDQAQIEVLGFPAVGDGVAATTSRGARLQSRSVTA